MADLLLQLTERFASFYGRFGRPLFGSSGNSRLWPGPGFRGGRRKLTLADKSIAPKVSSLTRRRAHTAGQERVLATDRIAAAQ
jgi:hypothetical protein